jgi:hypothetical protein
METSSGGRLIHCHQSFIHAPQIRRHFPDSARFQVYIDRGKYALSVGEDASDDTAHSGAIYDAEHIVEHAGDTLEESTI